MCLIVLSVRLILRDFPPRRGEFGRRGGFGGQFRRGYSAVAGDCHGVFLLWRSRHRLSPGVTWAFFARPFTLTPLSDMSGLGLQPLTAAGVKAEKGPRWQATRGADGALCATALPVAAGWQLPVCTVEFTCLYIALYHVPAFV